MSAREAFALARAGNVPLRAAGLVTSRVDA